MRYGCEFKPTRPDCRFPNCRCEDMSPSGAIICDEPEEELAGPGERVPRLPPERLCE